MYFARNTQNTSFAAKIAGKSSFDGHLGRNGLILSLHSEPESSSPMILPGLAVEVPVRKNASQSC
jgi:hypothetical protein